MASNGCCAEGPALSEEQVPVQAVGSAVHNFGCLGTDPDCPRAPGIPSAITPGLQLPGRQGTIDFASDHFLHVQVLHVQLVIVSEIGALVSAV